MNFFNEKVARYVFQFAVALVLAYFGVQALLNPDIQAALWVSQNISTMIEIIIPVEKFIFLLGVTQVIASIFLVINKFIHIVLPVVIFLFIGIIINLGFNEIALRDFVILIGVVYLYFSTKTANAKV
jgi:hypothetical protein